MWSGKRREGRVYWPKGRRTERETGILRKNSPKGKEVKRKQPEVGLGLGPLGAKVD